MRTNNYKGGETIKSRTVLIMFLMIIFISSIGAVNAYEIDENQTDNLESEISLPDEDNTQDILSASDSTQPELESKNMQNSGSAYLVLDNDADKENIYVGDYVTWILEAQNFGPDTAKNVKIHNKLPDGLKYIKHKASKGTFNQKTGIWDIDDLSIEEGLVKLLITTKALTVGEKINEAYITSDTNNTNNETFEEEEIDVLARDDSDASGFEKHASAKMYNTGNPIFLVIASLFIITLPIIKK